MDFGLFLQNCPSKVPAILSSLLLVTEFEGMAPDGFPDFKENIVGMEGPSIHEVGLEFPHPGGILIVTAHNLWG